MHPQALATADLLIGYQRQVLDLPHSNKLAERNGLANMLHLKGQAMERNRMSMEDNLKCQEEAIKLEEQNEKEAGKPEELLGRLYQVKAFMCEALDRSDQSKEFAKKALNVYEKLEEGETNAIHSQTI